MPTWLNLIFTKWPDLVITFVGVFAGSLLSFLTIKWQMSKETCKNTEAYLTNLLFEFEDNLKILRSVKKFIMPGPNIDHLWSPAEVNSNYLMTDSWNELVKAGILTELDERDTRLFRITNRTVRDVKRIINEISVNWIRIDEWHEHDIREKNQLLTSRENYKNTVALNDSTKAIENAIKRLEESIERLRKQYPESH